MGYAHSNLSLQLPSEEQSVPAEPVAMAMVVPPPGYSENAVLEQEGGELEPLHYMCWKKKNGAKKVDYCLYCLFSLVFYDFLMKLGNCDKVNTVCLKLW